jgi:hypothetical protein|tara:strand:- start:356 stop:562 length:207 start_codon:yes stop_codon:yes gene_type:complete
MAFLFTVMKSIRSIMQQSNEKIGSLEWDANGELSAEDVFAMIQRIKDHELPPNSSQLLQLTNRHRHSR